MLEKEALMILWPLFLKLKGLLEPLKIIEIAMRDLNFRIHAAKVLPKTIFIAYRLSKTKDLKEKMEQFNILLDILENLFRILKLDLEANKRSGIFRNSYINFTNASMMEPLKVMAEARIEINSASSSLQ